MSYEHESLATERAVLVFGVALTALAFFRPLFDVFAPLKLSIAAITAIVVTALAILRAHRLRSFDIPRSLAVYAAGAFAVAVLVVVLTADTPMLSFVGRVHRHVGGALYLACVLAFFAAIRTHTGRAGSVPVFLARALAGATAVAAAYSILQALGVDPWFPENDSDNVAFSTFGNVNFAAAWYAAMLPLIVWLGIRSRLSRERLAMVGIATVTVIAIVVTGSSQGPIAGAVGLLSFVVLAGRPLVARVDRRQLVAGAAIGALAIVAAIVVLDLPKDIARSIETRGPKWRAATTMVADDPVTGVGFGGFLAEYRSVRSEAIAGRQGANDLTDAPHSVPLQLLAEGGIVLALPYALFVAAIAVAIVSGVRKQRDDARVALAAVGASWVALQAQSLASIDVPPLAILSWTLAGVVVALTATNTGSVSLGRVASRRRKAGGSTPARVAIVVVTVVVAWLATTPLRADIVAGEASRSATTPFERRIERLESAAGLAWWEPRYTEAQGALLRRGQAYDRARVAYETTLQRDARDVPATIGLARTYRDAGDLEQAMAAYRRAIALDPRGPSLLAEAATTASVAGLDDEANELIERATQIEPRRSSLWVRIGQAREALGDTDEAIAAYERALEIRPENEEARARLAELE